MWLARLVLKLTYYIRKCRIGCMALLVFFFNDTATPEIYTLSLHGALPIFIQVGRDWGMERITAEIVARNEPMQRDRKSTRLNSSHLGTSYAVFGFKKK